jgi:hypothetical protein
MCCRKFFVNRRARFWANFWFNVLAVLVAGLDLGLGFWASALKGGVIWCSMVCFLLGGGLDVLVAIWHSRGNYGNHVLQLIVRALLFIWMAICLIIAGVNLGQKRKKYLEDSKTNDNVGKVQWVKLGSSALALLLDAINWIIVYFAQKARKVKAARESYERELAEIPGRRAADGQRRAVEAELGGVRGRNPAGTARDGE